MEELEHSLFLVDFVNKILSKPLSSFLALVGVEVKNPEHFIPDYVIMSFIAAGILILFFSLSSKKPTLIPSKLQSVLELIIQFFENLLSELIGKDGKIYLPMVGTLGLFILACNLMGLVPGFMSPTSKLNVTVGCALTVFVYYHWQGIKSQGLFKYFKHFMGPIPFLAPLMVPIEIISHFFATPFSFDATVWKYLCRRITYPDHGLYHTFFAPHPIHADCYHNRCRSSLCFCPAFVYIYSWSCGT